ncbi:MAG TPA: M4 family metallopeptidase, partial [Luteimonas sp.]|nr:M4 family metallopeptidase [Luteimonas sp.]
MKYRNSLLSLAIVSALAVGSNAFAAQPGADSGADADAVLAAKAAAVARAQALVDGPARKLVHRASADGFTAEVTAVQIDDDGTEHVRFQRTYKGDLPVIGGDFVLHSRNGKVLDASQTLPTSKRPSTKAAYSSNKAIAKAIAEFGMAYSEAPDSRLVLYALSGTPRLAHEVVLRGTRADQTPTEMHYFVDAKNGKLLDRWDEVQTARPGRDGGGCASPVAADGTGHSLTQGTVDIATVKCAKGYQMMDLTRGGGYTTNMAMRQAGMGSIFTDADNTWGNGGLTSSATVAVDAHFGVSATWDYYKDVHGRLGIADNGVGAVSRVHFGRNYPNAFWRDSCFCMTFGDGDNGVSILPLVALDIAGHEMSHGVTSRTAGLVYSGESGGLNEATSDIFGTMVEYYANNSNDPGDYVIGEELFPNNAAMSNAIRWMFKPSLDGASPDCYSSGIGGIDVHYSSGVANHFYYLLAEGAVVPAGFGSGTWANLTA